MTLIIKNYLIKVDLVSAIQRISANNFTVFVGNITITNCTWTEIKQLSSLMGYDQF